MSLTGIAKETLQILEKGEFFSNHGNVINFAVEQKLAEKNTQRQRAGYVLAVAQNNGHRSLLLGA
jgi:hypothetical protein